jgi:hypothetical protein
MIPAEIKDLLVTSTSLFLSLWVFLSVVGAWT